jgi:hypothetical protein
MMMTIQKLLSVVASMMQAYAGVFGAVIYQQIVTSPASPDLGMSLLLILKMVWAETLGSFCAQYA